MPVRKKRGKIRILLFVFFALLFAVSAARLICIEKENRQSRELNRDLVEMFFQEESREESEKPEAEASRQEEEPAEILPAYDFAPLLALNQDTVGWLYIPEADVSQPVVQGTDNEYYLHRNIRGEAEYAGAVFMDYRCEWGISPNTVLYGHNMTDGSMFAPLKKYMEEEFGVSHPYFWYLTPEGVYRCEIFSVYLTTAGDEEYVQTEFTGGEWVRVLEEWRERSAYAFPEVELDAETKVLTLSTCNYAEVWEEGRQAIHAKLILVGQNQE